VQLLGNGFSGDLTTIVLKAYGNTAGSIVTNYAGYTFALLAFTDANYDTYVSTHEASSCFITTAGGVTTQGDPVVFDFTSGCEAFYGPTNYGTTLDPSTYYAIWMSNPNVSNASFYGSASDNYAGGQFCVSSANPGGSPSQTTGLANCVGDTASVADWTFQFIYDEAFVDTSTHITSVVPHATTTATTTTVGVEAYINETDWDEDMYIEASFFNPTIGATSANVIDACNVFGAGQCKLRFPVSASGEFASSTEITFNYGGTTKVTWTIRKPTFWSGLWVVGALFQDQVLDTWKDSFVVGYQTLFDQSLNGDGTQVDGDASGLVGYFTTGGTSSTTPVAVGCATIFTGGSIVSCLTGLIIPDSQTLAYDFKLLYDGAFSKVPFGYITRFLTIVSGNAGAVEPPELSYTFGSSSPAVLQGKNYTMQIWDHTEVLTAAVADDGSNKNIWDIVMPYFNVVVALVVLLGILTDLMGFEFGRTPREIEEDMYGSLTPSEKALANRAQIQARHGGGTVKR